MGCPRRGWRQGAAGLLLALAACRSHPGSSNPTLVILNDADVVSLDPHRAGCVFQTQTVLANIYEGLVGLDRELRPQPALSVAWTNPDDRTWAFVLRTGVVFHDGGTLDADDVRFSLERARNSPTRSLARAALGTVEEIRTLPGGRVTLRTREPDAALLSRLREVPIVSRHCLEQRGEAVLATHSCGTGPYRLVEHQAGAYVELQRHQSYWGGPAPFASVRFVARGYGDADVARWSLPGASQVFFAPATAPALERASREATAHEGRDLGVSYLSFDLRGGETPGVTHPDGSHRNPFHDTAGTPFRSGFGVDLEVRELMRAYAPTLAADLVAIGIRAQVKTRPDPEFFPRLREGHASLYLLRFSCRTGDAQELLDKWVHSRDAERGYGEFNYSYQQDPVPGLDEEIEAARRQLDPAQRLAQLRVLMRRVMEARLAIPLLQEGGTVFASPEIVWAPRADGFFLVAEMKLAGSR